MKICILTVYKPTFEDLNNIANISQIFDRLIIIDNNLLSCPIGEYSFGSDSVIILSNFNMGGLSGAFNLAKSVLRHLQLNPDSTVTLLDQDTFVTSPIIEALVCEVKSSPCGYIFGAKFSQHNAVTYPVERITVNCLPTSTTTMRVSDFELSSKYDPRFPVDLADFVWCWKNSTENNFTFTQLNNVHVKQTLGIKRFKFLGRCFTLPSAFRHEHQMRAARLLWSLDYLGIDIKLRFTVKAVLKIISYPFIFPDGTKRLRYMLRGIFYD